MRRKDRPPKRRPANGRPKCSRKQLVGTLIRIERRTARVWSFVRCHDCDRGLQREVQHGFRRQLDLLTLGCGLHAAAKPAAGCCADGRSLTAAGDGADNRANSSTCADLLSRVLAARSSLTAVLIGLDGVVLVADFHPIKLEGEQRLPCELPGTLNIHDMAFNVIACRNRDVALNRQW